MQSNPADYAETAANAATQARAGEARTSQSGAQRLPHAPRRYRREPPAPSAAGYLAATLLLAASLSLGVWWLFASAGDDTPWLPAAVCAGVVLVVAIAAREVVVRRAWSRYTRELEHEMARGTASGREVAPAAASHAPRRKASVQAAAASLRTLQQRLSAAEEAGARAPEAHLEAYRLCEQYLANTEDAMRSSRTSTEVRVALRAGQERVRELKRHHLLAWARGEAQRITHEAQRRASVSGRIETAMRALDVIGEAMQVYPDEPELRDSVIAVRNYIASVKVAHWVELAERAAFRGRYGRAIARYRDALFYLSRAEMGEAERDSAAERITREIEMLRARVATDGDADGEDASAPPTRRGKKDPIA